MSVTGWSRMAALWRNVRAAVRSRRRGPTRVRRVRPGVERLDDRTLLSAAGPVPHEVIDLNELAGTPGQVQTAYVGADPAPNVSPNAVVLCADASGQDAEYATGAAAVSGPDLTPGATYILDLKHTEDGPLSLVVKRVDPDGSTRVLTSDSPETRILLLLGQGDGRLPVQVGGSLAHLEGAVLTTQLDGTDQAFYFDAIHLQSREHGHDEWHHYESPTWDGPEPTPGKESAGRARQAAQGTPEDSADDGGQGADNLTALALVGLPEGPGGTGAPAAAGEPLDDGPPGPHAPTGEIDVNADSREAPLLVRMGELPPAQLDLVPLEPKNLAVVPTFVAGRAPGDSGPEGGPGGGRGRGAAPFVAGLGPVPGTAEAGGTHEAEGPTEGARRGQGGADAGPPCAPGLPPARGGPDAPDPGPPAVTGAEEAAGAAEAPVSAAEGLAPPPEWVCPDLPDVLFGKGWDDPVVNGARSLLGTALLLALCRAAREKEQAVAGESRIGPRRPFGNPQEVGP